MKKLLFMLVLLAMMVSMLACGKETVTMTCDYCGDKVQMEKVSEEMNDDTWIIACEDCADQVWDAEP